MKQCKGCGAFYNDKCPYCGYNISDIVYEDKKFVTLKISGSMNDIIINHGECNKELIKISGNMQDISVRAEYINIELNGNMNDIQIDKRVKYFSTIKGNMNDVGEI